MTERFFSGTCSLRAAQLPGAMQGSPFLKSFGKPDRLLTCECERSEATTLAQAFQMINGETVRRKLESPFKPDRQTPGGRRNRYRIFSEFYLTAICREPRPRSSRRSKRI